MNSNVNNIHFICLDSETSGRLPSNPMPSWLRQDLMATTQDWIVAYWHSPPYSKGSHDSDRESELIGMRQRLVPILEEFGVDLVLGGHSHNYERSFLLHGHYGSSSSLQSSMILNGGSGRTNESGAYIQSPVGPVAQAGTVYVVAGSSGWATFTTGRHPVMYSQFLVTGSMVIDVNRNRLDAKFLRATGVIADSFTILKAEPDQSFKLVEILWNDGHEIVRWESRPGQIYQLQWTESLDPPDWFPIGGLIHASGTSVSWTNRVLQTWPQSFYRVMEVED